VSALAQLTLDEVDPRYRVSEIEKGRWLKPCFGARCTSCGAWLTKWDFTPEDAAASAAQALETHSCSLPSERAV
jgi:hypothetical protein